MTGAGDEGTRGSEPDPTRDDSTQSDPGPPTSETSPLPKMSRVRLRWGGATDVGQLREVNEDSMVAGPDLFVVADGMGGHAAGDVASQLTIRTLGDQLPTTDDGNAGATDGSRDAAAVPVSRVTDLVAAIQAANDVVWDTSENDPSLAGMGTTVVAIGVVVEDRGDGELEERIAIVNVGDSRAYRLSDGHLDQISDDHSLVGELVREGSLSPEEAHDHPRKNIVTRAIGIEPYVEVDEFSILPRAGDRYLLCSDGLTDEILDDEILVILRDHEDPQDAADTLVAAANANGGRDNVTIVVVDVVDDGLEGGTAATSALVGVPDHDDFSEHPESDTDTFDAVPPDVAPVDDSEASASRGRATPRALTIRSLAFVLVVLLVVGGGSFLAWNYVRNTYFVGIDDDQVVIYRGRPGGVLWIDPTVVEPTGIPADDVPEDTLDDLEAGVSTSTLSGARRYVDNLDERIEAITPPVSTTTTRPDHTTTTTTDEPAAGSETTTTTTAVIGP